MASSLQCKSRVTEIALLKKQLAAAKAELAAARAEIQTLRMRLKNAEMMYKFELAKSRAKKVSAKRAERN